MTKSSFDPQDKRPPAVESVPSGLAEITNATTLVYPASDPDPSHVPKGDVTFAVTTFPDSDQLSLWNWLWNIYVDVDDEAHDYFGGVSLTDAQRRNIVVMDNMNWAQSSDLFNTRVHRIKILNNDTVAHSFFLKYKAYTFTGAAGS